MPPKVSVIVPNYNHAGFLQQRIDSILEQTFTDFELIILDDKSTDSSVEVIEKYRGNLHVTHVVYNEINSGSSFVQWSKGMSLCQGEYIWIAESDDVADKDFLGTMAKVLDQNESVSVAYCQSYAIDETGQVTGTCLKLTDKLDKEKWKHDFVADGTDYIKKYMIFQNVIPNASGVLFRKSAIEKSGNPYQSYRLNGDWHFWITLLHNSGIAYVAACLNYFRMHSNTVRSQAIREGLNYLEYTRIIIYIFSNFNFSPDEKRNVIAYFHGEVNYRAPINFGNLIRSYFNLARYDLSALKFLVAQIWNRYLKN
jgi:glycosyltransferase involved in cell wall biosynthesis